jgi:hypothetical protein
MAADLATRIEYFESSEETTYAERQNGERYRRYYDGAQLTDAEIQALKKRGQPPVIINKCRAKINFYKGMERNNLSDPKAYPRNMHADEMSADAATQCLRYQVQAGKYAHARKRAWDNITIEGMGGIKLHPRPGRDRMELEYKCVRWDRMFRDPHSEEDDFSDASYLGEVLWMDKKQALALYGPEAEDIVESTMSHNTHADTFDDKPRWKLWGDRGRQRVRVVQMYCREAEGWYVYEFTRAGDLREPAEAWLRDEQGRPTHPYVWRSAYVEGESNARYGPMRDLIDPQDEYNKRRSKSLHLLNTRGMILTKGSVPDAEAVRRELAKPDFVIELQDVGADSKFELIDNIELGAAQTRMLEISQAELEVLGPNASMQGKDSRDQSGRAIIAQQQGGMIEAGDLTDQLDSMDEETYRKTWLFIQQHWTEETTIRVTDDEDAVRWIGLNTPVMNEFGFQAGVENNVAEMDMDIIIEPAPKVVLPEGEEFMALAQISPQIMEAVMNGQSDIARLFVESIPSIRPTKKRRLLAYIDKAEQAQVQQAQAAMQAAQQQMQMEAQAEAQKAQAVAQAKAQGDVMKARMAGPIELEKARIQAQAAQEVQTPLDRMQQVADIRKTEAEIVKLGADTYKAKKDADRPAPARASA